MEPKPNGNVLQHRVKQLEHKLRGAEQATRFLAEKGAKNNDQILVHDEQIRALRAAQDELRRAQERYETEVHDDLVEIKGAVRAIPVLIAQVADINEQRKAFRTAVYAATSGLFLLAASIFWQVIA